MIKRTATPLVRADVVAGSREEGIRSLAPADFIELERHKGVTRVRFAVELRFDLASGKVDEFQHAAIAHDVRPAETSE